MRKQLASLRSEMLKTKGTATLYLALVTAAIIPLFYLLGFLLGSTQLHTVKNPWNSFFLSGLEAMGTIVLPIYIILSCTLLPQIEYRNHTWKQTLTTPQLKAQLYLSKFLAIQFYIVLLLLLFAVFMILSAGLSQLIMPQVSLFSEKSNWALFGGRIAKLYMGVFAMSSFQLWMGIRYRSFIAPVGIGIGLLILSALLLFEYKWDHVDKFPFAYPILQMFPVAHISMLLVNGLSLVYALIFATCGYLEFKKKTRWV